MIAFEFSFSLNALILSFFSLLSVVQYTVTRDCNSDEFLNVCFDLCRKLFYQHLDL